MSDDVTPGQEPTPSGQEPQSPPAPTLPPPTGPEPKGDAPERFDADYVRELRRSEAATRKRLQEAEARLKADEEAKLSEQERLAKRVADLEAQVAERDRTAAALRLQHAVDRTARDLGFADPDDAHRFLDREAVELGDDGTPRNLKALLSKVLEQKPYLKGGTNGNGQHGGPPATPKPAGAPTQRELVTQTKQELQRSGRYSF